MCYPISQEIPGLNAHPVGRLQNCRQRRMGEIGPRYGVEAEVATVPILILTVLLQRYIVQGLTLGWVRE
jgi:ABC-type glycerol-3-phosphate transport system permease component